MQLPERLLSRSRFFLLLLALGMASPFATRVWSQNWQAMGSGFNMYPKAFYVDTVTNLLYATGNQMMVDDSIPVKGISVWDGVKWDSVVVMNEYYPNFITRYNGVFYFGYDDIITYNGVQIDTIRVANGGVDNFFIYQGDLIAMGQFDSLDGKPISSIARFDGTTWSAFDSTQWYGQIYKAIEYQNELYIWGGLSNYNATIVNIARWDGTKWNSVDSNALSNGWNSIADMAVYHGDLWISGIFNEVFGNPWNGIARWDGTKWLDPGGGIGFPTAQIFSMVVWNDELIVGGAFPSIAGLPVLNLAKWNGVEWCGMGFPNTDTNKSITALGIYNNELIVGGNFRTIDGDTLNYIAKWIGGSYTDTCGIQISVVPPIQDGNLFTAYPNPVKDQLWIEFHDPLERGVLIKLIDYSGRVVRENQYFSIFKGEILTIQTEELTAGIYFLILETANRRHFSRLIKEE